jgi:lipopolysaccharide export system protein LptC
MTDGRASSRARAQTVSWNTQAPRSFEQPLEAARRHSRLVRRLRAGVPAIVVFGLTAIVTSSYLSKVSLPQLPVVVGISGTRVTMEVPHLGGFTRDGRAYQLSAVAASQDFTKPDELELSGIKAKLLTRDNATITMTAVAGTYNIKTQMLDLTHDIEVTSTDGKRAELSEAQIETAKGNVVSNKPVKIEFAGGDLRANKLEMVNGGELVRFTGAVLLHAKGQPAKGQAAKDQPAKKAPAPATGSVLAKPGGQQGPIRIKAGMLEMRDKEHVATFTGDVVAVQDEATLKCDALIVNYEGDAEDASSGQQIKHLDGKGHVILTQKDQIATGDTLNFDQKTNIATLLGHVSVTQDQNVVRGDKLVINLTTGEAHVDAAGNDPQGQVESVFYPKQEEQPTIGPKPRSQAKPASPGPMALHGH